MKKTFFFLTILFSAISLFADPVDREQAYKNAQKFLKNNGSGTKLNTCRYKGNSNQSGVSWTDFLICKQRNKYTKRSKRSNWCRTRPRSE